MLIRFLGSNGNLNYIRGWKMLDNSLTEQRDALNPFLIHLRSDCGAEFTESCLVKYRKTTSKQCGWDCAGLESKNLSEEKK